MALVEHPALTDRPRVNGALVWSSVLLCLLAIGFATIYVAQPTQASEVFDVESVRATQPPVTIPPVEPEVMADEQLAEPGLADADAAPETPQASRQAALDAGETLDVGALIGQTTSALPVPLEGRPMPVAVEIDSIDVTRFPIRDVGLEDDGQLEVPDETEIGWYRYGATAGRPGATVLAAHVSWNGTTGPFFELGTVSLGDRIAVTLDDGTDRHYEVVERTVYDKDELPRGRIWRSTGSEELVLITCGGDFNPEIRRYRQNIVVYAVPVA